MSFLRVIESERSRTGVEWGFVHALGVTWAWMRAGPGESLCESSPESNTQQPDGADSWSFTNWTSPVSGGETKSQNDARTFKISSVIRRCGGHVSGAPIRPRAEIRAAASSGAGSHHQEEQVQIQQQKCVWTRFPHQWVHFDGIFNTRRVLYEVNLFKVIFVKDYIR